MPDRSSSLAAEAALLFIVLVWGVNFAVIKVPLEVMPPFVVNVVRFGIAALVLGLLHVWQCRQRGETVLRTFRVGAWPVVGLSLLGHVVYQVGFILGLERITAGGAALLVASSPLWTAAVAHVSGIERLSGRGWIGVLVSLAGVVLVVLGRPEREVGGDLLGIALLLGGSVAWGAFTALSRPVMDRGATPVGFAFWGILIALPFLGALAGPTWSATPWTALDALDWLALLFSGGLSIGLANWVWSASVRGIGPARTAAYANLVPFVGVAAGALLLKESVRPLQLAGGVLIIVGLVVLRRWK